MSPMSTSQRPSYIGTRPHPADNGNTQNHMIHTLNKSTISAKQSKKIPRSLGTLGLVATSSAKMMEQDNIEEMHGVLVAFYIINRNMLHRIEGKEESTREIQQKPDGNLLTLVHDDVDLS